MRKALLLLITLYLSSSVLFADITIKQGWQLLSSPKTMSASIFNNTCVDYLWKYDMQVTTPEWKIYIANGRAYTHTSQTFTQLNKAEGFWLLGNGSCVIAITEDTNTTGTQLTFTNANDSAQLLTGTTQNLNLLDGNDSLVITGTVAHTIDAGDGNDSITLNSYTQADMTNNVDNIQSLLLNFENFTFKVDTTPTKLVFTDGNDSAEFLTGTTQDIDMLDGNDTLSITGSVTHTMQAGDGIDSLFLHSYTQSQWDRNVNNIQTLILNFEKLTFSDSGTLPVLEATTMHITEDTNDSTIIGDISILDTGASPITRMSLGGDGNRNFSITKDGDVSVISTQDMDFNTTQSYELFAYATNANGDSAKVSVTIILVDNEIHIIDVLNNTNITTNIGHDSITIASIQGSTSLISTLAGDDNVSIGDINASYDSGRVNLGSGDDRLTIDSNLSGVLSTFDGGNGDNRLVLKNVDLVAWANGISSLFSNFDYIEFSDGSIFQLLPIVKTATFSVDENASSGTFLGNVNITTLGTTAITSTALSGTGSGDFNITLDGNITLNAGVALDFNVTSSYLVTVQATNAHGTSEANITINVNEIVPGQILTFAELTSSLDTNTGDDVITITRLNSRDAVINTLAGNDTLTIVDVSSTYDSGTVNLGDGNDKLTLKDNLSGAASTYDGGNGFDTLVLTEIDFDRWDDNKDALFTNFNRIELSDGTVLTP